MESVVYKGFAITPSPVFTPRGWTDEGVIVGREPGADVRLKIEPGEEVFETMQLAVISFFGRAREQVMGLG